MFFVLFVWWLSLNQQLQEGRKKRRKEDVQVFSTKELPRQIAPAYLYHSVLTSSLGPKVVPLYEQVPSSTGTGVVGYHHSIFRNRQFCWIVLYKTYATRRAHDSLSIRSIFVCFISWRLRSGKIYVVSYIFLLCGAGRDLLTLAAGGGNGF